MNGYIKKWDKNFGIIKSYSNDNEYTFIKENFADSKTKIIEGSKITFDIRTNDEGVSLHAYNIKIVSFPDKIIKSKNTYYFKDLQDVCSGLIDIIAKMKIQDKYLDKYDDSDTIKKDCKSAVFFT